MRNHNLQPQGVARRIPARKVRARRKKLIGRKGEDLSDIGHRYRESHPQNEEENYYYIGSFYCNMKIQRWILGVV